MFDDKAAVAFYHLLPPSVSAGRTTEREIVLAFLLLLTRSEQFALP